jgi:hypothetical protein
MPRAFFGTRHAHQLECYQLPLSGKGVIDNVPVIPDSQMAPPPEAVGVEVKAVDIKLRPRPSLRRRGTVHPEGRSPVRGSETKLRILSVEVRYTANT